MTTTTATLTVTDHDGVTMTMRFHRLADAIEEARLHEEDGLDVVLLADSPHGAIRLV